MGSYVPTPADRWVNALFALAERWIRRTPREQAYLEGELHEFDVLAAAGGARCPTCSAALYPSAVNTILACPGCHDPVIFRH